MKQLFLIFIFYWVCLGVYAQKSTVYTHQNAIYNSALELYDKEKFSAAQEKFLQIIKNHPNQLSEVIVNATYYHALCGLELFNNDAENLLVEFILTYPESPKVKLAYFHLGRYKFRKKRYDEVLDWFAKINIYDLSEEEKAEYYFKKGYAHFMEEQYDDASTAFFEIKDTDNKYNSTARYYYAHISYLQKKYEPALQTFLMLSNDIKFKQIVPYYITQIYYLQEKYNKVIDYAPKLLDSAIAKRAPEIARVLGEAYYRTEKYEDAIPYLERFQKEKAYLSNRQDKYQLGYAYFKTNQCTKAIEWFKKSITKDDSLSQTAHYHLSECYLKLDKKKYAKTSFELAANMNFDSQIKEDALFSFAKIAYELSIHPYNDAIKAFELFINTYPQSQKLDDAYEFLIAVYFTTKNYKAALTSLEKIKNKNAELEKAYQKIAYYRGVELFNNRKYQEAILHFNKSDKYLIGEKTKADNLFWRAEAYYRLGKYNASINEYKKYLFEPEPIANNTIKKAYYGIGYAYFKLKEYANANVWLRKYVQTSNKEKNNVLSDALIRIGDCFYIQKEYNAAIEYYDRATLLGIGKIDYSLYQSAITNGVIGDYQEKNTLLKTLISQKNKSHLLDDAIFQLGRTQLMINNENDALVSFKQIISDYPNSPYKSDALIQEGLIYYNKKEDDKALSSFKLVVQDYSGTENAKEALQKIKKIYIDKGELSTYENYLLGIGSADSSALVMDADYFEVAENVYMNENCDKAVKELTFYLEKYPKGQHVLAARFYKADCEYHSNFENEALIDFNYVIAQSKNKFTEVALLKAGKLNLKLGKTKEALDIYSKLEYLADIPANVFTAQVEQMRLNYQLKNYDETIKYCTLIIDKDIDDASLITESHLIYGKAVMAKDDYNLALKEFTTASSSTNKFGAEAKYYVAYILYLRGEYNKCETEVFSLIKKFPSYNYWVSKVLILLADNYVAQEDLFQAKITLKNVMKNSKYAELISSAQDKLTIIEQQENQQNKVEEEEDIDLKLFDEKDIRLFQEEEVIFEEELPQKNNSENEQELNDENDE